MTKNPPRNVGGTPRKPHNPFRVRGLRVRLNYNTGGRLAVSPRGRPNGLPQSTKVLVYQPPPPRKTTETQRRHRASCRRRNHEDTKTRRNHKATRLPARSRPPGGQGPVGRAAAPNASVRSSDSPHRPALSESAGLASQTFSDWAGSQTLALEQARPRRNRRAASASAGGKSDRDGCLHPERSGFSPGAGDLRIAGVAAAPLQATSPTQVSLLCVLRVFVVATVLASVSSVPLWFARCDGAASICTDLRFLRVDGPLLTDHLIYALFIPILESPGGTRWRSPT